MSCKIFMLVIVIKIKVDRRRNIVTVKEANIWIEKIQTVIDNLDNIYGVCYDDLGKWRKLQEEYNIRMESKDFFYIAIKALYNYKKMVQDKIDNAEIED